MVSTLVCSNTTNTGQTATRIRHRDVSLAQSRCAMRASASSTTLAPEPESRGPTLGTMPMPRALPCRPFSSAAGPSSSVCVLESAGVGLELASRFQSSGRACRRRNPRSRTVAPRLPCAGRSPLLCSRCASPPLASAETSRGPTPATPGSLAQAGRTKIGAGPLFSVILRPPVLQLGPAAVQPQ